MNTGSDVETVTLWRPTGPEELALVQASGWREWPPRLPEQPIFYPVRRLPACDSAAFRADDARFAIVHLTWALRRESPPWPLAEVVAGYRALEAAADKHGDTH